jgi:hypothetical protein
MKIDSAGSHRSSLPTGCTNERIARWYNFPTLFPISFSSLVCIDLTTFPPIHFGITLHYRCAGLAPPGHHPSAGVTIAPGVIMPLISNGAITNGSWFPNNTLETPGIELWLSDRVGGRGVDTAWCYTNQPQVTSSSPRPHHILTHLIVTQSS